MQTSFNKKQRGKGGVLQINGTQSSLHNGQLLCSTGIPSLDGVIGGGIPVGSVFILEEDFNHQYSDVLTRYFLAEAVVSRHEVFTVGNEDEGTFLNHLPKPVLNEDTYQVEVDKRDMKIAWRYQDSPQVQTSTGNFSKYGHYYDISKHMDEKTLTNSNFKHVDLRLLFEKYQSKKPQDMLKHILKELHKHITENNFDIATVTQSKKSINILRVVVPGFLSPFWPREIIDAQNLVRFLICLRGILRKSLAICWLTVPTHLYPSNVTKLLRHNADMVIRLESFGRGKTNPLYKDYHGLLKIEKLPTLNCLAPYMPDTYDLAFKLRRKRFAVERLHLPPDITDSASRQGVEEETGYLNLRYVNIEKKPSMDF